MLVKSNLLALVGGGVNPRYAPNYLIIWNDTVKKVIKELRFSSYITAVKIKMKKIYVVLEQKLFVLDIDTFEKVATYDTFRNEKGIFSVSGCLDYDTFAFASVNSGEVELKSEKLSQSPTIKAHDTPIAAIALNIEGTLLATCSEKGTLVRIYNTETGKMEKEFRRGRDSAVINNLSFNTNSTLLAVSSNKGTVHIFAVGSEDEQQKQNKKSMLMHKKLRWYSADQVPDI